MFYYNCILSILCCTFWLYLIYAIFEITNKRAPFVPAIGKHKQIAIDTLSLLLKNKKEQLIIIDAGCGNGSIIAQLAQSFPAHKFIGIEHNKTLYKYCQQHWKSIINLSFIHQDLLNFDYQQSDIIYYFGIPSLTKQLENKLINLNKTIDIISIEEQFSQCFLINKIPFKVLTNTSYVYHYKNYLAK